MMFCLAAMRCLSLRIVAPLILVLIALLACEIVLQVASRYVRHVHSVLMPPWERVNPLIPDAFRGNPYHPEHDAAGYRNAAQPTHAELVVLGDSQAYGSGVRRTQAWPQRLGAYNMALPGYASGHHLLQLDEALALRPRLVIVAPYFGNDLVDMWRLGLRHPELLAAAALPLRQAADAAERAGPLTAEIGDLLRMGTLKPAQATGPRRWISDHVRLYGLARALRGLLTPPAAIAVLSRDFTSSAAALTPIQRRYSLPVDADGWRTILTPAYRGRTLDDTDPRVRVGFEASREALRQIHARARAQGVAVLVVLHPTKEAVFWPRGQTDARMRRLVADETRLRAELLTWLAERQIPSVDLLDPLRAAPTQPYFEDVDGHPNDAGHAVIAATVAPLVRR